MFVQGDNVSKVVNPSKIIAVGLNYIDHAKELHMGLPNYPLIFLKPSTSVIGDGDEIFYPPETGELHYEGELAVVIGEVARKVPPDHAHRHIAGYTCANDVTARDLQRIDGQWTRAKSFDTFCPLGPRVVGDINPAALRIMTRVNGETKQFSTTSNMIFGVYELVSFVSGIMTLLPGDVIITGTPPGVGPLFHGDRVEVEIEGIGTLKNIVTARMP